MNLGMCFEQMVHTFFIAFKEFMYSPTDRVTAAWG